MKNKSKIIIASSVVVAGAVATTAALIPTMLKEEGSKNVTIQTKDIKNPVVTEKNEQLELKNEINSELPKTEKVENNSTTTQEAKKLKLSFKELNEKSKDKAIFKFLKDNKTTETVDEVEVSFGDTVSFKVEYTSKENITLTDLRVYVGTEAWSLGVYYDSDKDIYEISIPSADSDWAKEFIKDKSIITNLEFKAYFGPAKINDWTYDFNSRTYAIEITEEGFVFDDVTNPGHKIVDLENDHVYNQPTQFRVYLGGHNIKIKNLTVPAGTQLMFINESEYSNTLDNRPTPIIDLDGGYRKMNEQLKIYGAVGRYGDVEYSNAMKAACGLPVVLEDKDMDWKWIEEYNKNQNK